MLTAVLMGACVDGSRILKENNFMEIKKNPTNKYQREIKQLIKSSPKIFQNNSDGTINTGIHQNSSQHLRNKIAYGLTNNNPLL